MFIVALVAVLIAGGLSSQAGKLEEVQKSDLAEFLPGDAESVAALQAARAFDSGDVSPAVVVIARDGGLTAADREVLYGLRDVDLPLASPAAPEPTLRRQTRACSRLPLRGQNSDVVAEAVETLRGELEGAPSGLETAVTGPAGFSTDLKNVFAGADTRLLAVTGGLVLLLLIAIYRSPIFWLIPFFTVILTEGATRGLAALLGEAGLVINGQNAGILSVLVFGAATDYALLLVARYREELTRVEDAGEAMAVAWRGAAPAILASGATVIVGLLTLVVRDRRLLRLDRPVGRRRRRRRAVLEPHAPAGDARASPAGERSGRYIPRVGDDLAASHKVWHRLGGAIVAPSASALGRLVAGARRPRSGLTGLDTSLTQEQQLRGDPEAVVGQELLAKHFPAGLSAPASVIVPPGGDVEAVRTALGDAVQREEEGQPGTQLSVVLPSDPFSEDAVAFIPRLRDTVHAAEPRALVGGQTAQSYDLREAAERDNLVIPPLTLAVVLVILILLLRALVAPVLLLLATALSAAAALGAGVVIFDVILGLPAVDPALPLLAFVFLVALGIDYTIFLMARAREEAAVQGTRRGVLAASRSPAA